MIARDAEGRVIDAGLAGLLGPLGARAPSLAEEAALRAVARGMASTGQQKIAFRYTLELMGAAALAFDAGSERLTSFRLGAQAGAQALSLIAGGTWLAFPSVDESEDPDGH